MNDLIKANLDKLFDTVQNGYTDDEIKNFEVKNSISFPEEYKDFLRYTSYCTSNSFGTFQLKDGLEVYGMGAFFSLDDYNSWIDDMTESGETIEDKNSLYNFGSDSCSEGQRFFIGIKEPFFGKIYLLNWREGDGDIPVLNEEGMYVYPKHFVANSFDEFLEILINNLDNLRIGE